MAVKLLVVEGTATAGVKTVAPVTEDWGTGTTGTLGTLDATETSGVLTIAGIAVRVGATGAAGTSARALDTTGMA